MTANWVPENWMGSLDETKLLSEFTIPGTHETCSLHGGSITECQHLKLSEQLSAGIRAIDIRCRHFKDAFPIHHGAVYQKLNFTDVLNECKAFLDNHSTECIVMSVKNECTGETGSCKDEENTRTFEDTFDWYLEQDNNKDYFLYSGDNLSDALPQLKDVRKSCGYTTTPRSGLLRPNMAITTGATGTTFPLRIPTPRLSTTRMADRRTCSATPAATSHRRTTRGRGSSPPWSAGTTSRPASGTSWSRPTSERPP